MYHGTKIHPEGTFKKFRHLRGFHTFLVLQWCYVRKYIGRADLCWHFSQFIFNSATVKTPFLMEVCEYQSNH